jgi:hypothetical protein
MTLAKALLASTVLAGTLTLIGCDNLQSPTPRRSATQSCTGLCTTDLSSGLYVGPGGDQIAFASSVQNGAFTFDITDPDSGALLATSTVFSESSGSVTITGASAFDGSATPSDDDFAVIDAFNETHGNSVSALALLLDSQGFVSPGDPTQVGKYAALVQIVQMLQVYQSDVSTDLTALDGTLGTGYFNASASHAGVLSFGYASTDGETSPMAFPFVRTYNFLGDGSQLGAAGDMGVAFAAGGPAPAPIPNNWLCRGTPYQAGCRHMCGASCNWGTQSSSIRCADGILYRDTVYSGITNVCCAAHDDGYDACSARYNCGVGNCKTIVVPIPRRPFFRTIRISCATMIEVCRRVPDAGCVACALLNGYQASDCVLWTLGVGPGTPISFIDTVRIGTCCPRCAGNRASIPGAGSEPTANDVADGGSDDCVCTEY